MPAHILNKLDIELKLYIRAQSSAEYRERYYITHAMIIKQCVYIGHHQYPLTVDMRYNILPLDIFSVEVGILINVLYHYTGP